MLKKAVLLFPLMTLSACADTMHWLEGEEQPAAAAPAPALSAPQEYVQMDYLASAKNAEAAKDYLGAVQYYEQALRAEPGNRAAALGFAENLRRIAQYDRAMTVYDGILAGDPNSIDAKEGKALTYVEKGDYDTPVAIFEQVVKADPKRAKSLNGIGVLFTTRDMHSEASQYFSEAVRQSGNKPYDALRNLGLSQALEGRYDLAICTIKQTADLAQPGSADRKHVLMDLALVYAAAGQVEDALAVAGSYYAGSRPNPNFTLYPRLAADKKLAKAYMSTSIIATGVYYDDGWKKD